MTCGVAVSRMASQFRLCRMKLLQNNVAVTGTTAHAEWCSAGLIHDPWFAGQITKHLQPGDVMIEGGAHIGTLTRAALDCGAQVYAFEPNPAAAECLRWNCPEAVVFDMALGEHMHGSCGIEIVPDNAGMSYVTHGIGVSMTAIDRFKNVRIKLIKLDVEGSECAALRGAQEVIARYRPVLIVEVNRPALERVGESDLSLIKLIEELGYRWKILQPQCQLGDEQFDVECLPK